MNLKVKIRSQYGNYRIFPVCETALAFCEAFNIKSFTRDQIVKLKALGFVFEIEQETI